MGLAVTVIGTTVVRAMRNRNEAVSVSRMVFFFSEGRWLAIEVRGDGDEDERPR